MRVKDKKTVVIIAGKQGSGKSEVVKICEQSIDDTSIVRVSDIFKETLQLWQLPITVVNLRKVADMFKVSFGSDIISRVVESRVDSTKAPVVIVDGVRGFNVFGMLKQKYHIVLVYVECSDLERFNRVYKRREKVEDGRISFESFSESDKYRTETGVEQLKNEADLIVDNSLDINQLTNTIKSFLLKIDLSTM